MREARITLPELGMVAGTRAMGGIGLGLLLADRLSSEQRKAVGWTLLSVGILSTIPLAIEILGHSRSSALGLSQEKAARETGAELSERLGHRAAVPQI
jgi:hypothetical protein